MTTKKRRYSQQRLPPRHWRLPGPRLHARRCQALPARKASAAKPARLVVTVRLARRGSKASQAATAPPARAARSGLPARLVLMVQTARTELQALPALQASQAVAVRKANAARTAPTVLLAATP